MRRGRAIIDKITTFRALAADLQEGKIVFPTAVQVALRLKEALDDPECHVDLAARLVGAEPLLAARVVAVANSVAYNRSGRDITDLHQAIGRVGFATLRSLTMTLVVRQLAGAAHSRQHPFVQPLWEHCTQVASLARALARRVTHVDADTAMFAGLIHEIGGFYLLSQAEKHPALFEGGFDEWLEEGQAEIGRAMLRCLSVPASVVEGIEGVWAGYLAMPPASLADTLLLANALAPERSPFDGNACALEQPAAEIEMLIGEATLSEILGEASEEIDSLNAALNF